VFIDLTLNTPFSLHAPAKSGFRLGGPPTAP